MTRTARLAARRRARRDRIEKGVIGASLIGALIAFGTMISPALAYDEPVKIGDQVGPMIHCGVVESDCRPIYQGDGEWTIVFDPN